MIVFAVIVTHNRLPLLKECIRAVKSQSVLPDEIVVVNNASTDGTLQWLKEQDGVSIINQENLGGAGGFHAGFRDAALRNADWIWGMDDDTIPMLNALEKLLEKLAVFEEDKAGFLCSKAIWSDGSPHLMNLPQVSPLINNQHPFSTYDEHNVLLVEGCSFVSILLNSKIVKDLGLPYRQFYIWYDDKEYTNRITKAGFYGVYCPESVALHKTPLNYRVDLYSDSANNAWKYACAIRNELFIIKRDRGILYYSFFAPAKVLYSLFHILRNRKSHKAKFAKILLKSAIQSVTFNPSIDKI